MRSGWPIARTASVSEAPHLEARALRFAAGGRDILNGIELTVARGERLAVIGPNGSGKSTLLRCLYAWCKPSDGAAFLDGTDVRERSASARARQIAVLAQEGEGGLGLTVAEVVALGRLPYREGWAAASAADADVVADAIQRLDLTAMRDRAFAILSGGEKQRVLFARALAQQTRVLILDEPTNHLDIRHQLELLDLAANLGVTILATLHDINLAARWADRLVLMQEGRVRAVGDADAVLDPAVIGEVYGVEAARDTDPRTGALRLSFYPRPQ